MKPSETFQRKKTIVTPTGQILLGTNDLTPCPNNPKVKRLSPNACNLDCLKCRKELKKDE